MSGWKTLTLFAQGLDPKTGEFLRQRQSADRFGMLERNGEMRLEKIATARISTTSLSARRKILSILALEDPRAIRSS